MEGGLREVPIVVRDVPAGLEPVDLPGLQGLVRDARLQLLWVALTCLTPLV